MFGPDAPNLPMLPARGMHNVIVELNDLIDRGLLACNSQYVHRDAAGEVLPECPDGDENECEDCILRRKIVKLATTEYRLEWAELSWCVDDVVAKAKDISVECSREEAAQLLEDAEDEIQNAMIGAGAAVIESWLHELDDVRSQDMEDDSESEEFEGDE